MAIKPSAASAQRVTQRLLAWLRVNGVHPTNAIPALLVTAAKLAATDDPGLHDHMITLLRTALAEERSKALS
jgi:hypothetical protein